MREEGVKSVIYVGEGGVKSEIPMRGEENSVSCAMHNKLTDEGGNGKVPFDYICSWLCALVGILVFCLCKQLHLKL